METLLFLLHQCQARMTAVGLDAGDVLTALATLLGAAGGAYIGARGAYKGTVKANNHALQRSKLEEAYSALDEVITTRTEQMATVRDILKHLDATEVRRYAQQQLSIHDHLPAANRLATLVKFYLPEADQQVSELTGIQFLFDRFVRNLDDEQGKEDQARDSANSKLNEFQKRSSGLKAEIQQAHARLG
ncbi:hypothetical protein ACFPTY_03430 [Halomonas beimenensis]|uniref:Uncharacterized protein n=1 Tax=Halomonas beimenensis TaxID=475662 RepID=A0A291P539_9GAMM|nr:hypothetical protein [Halomonas beimenensis]ATJ82013.1 hypothetical protein BEI_1026 [Halomonas beimenensis]